MFPCECVCAPVRRCLMSTALWRRVKETGACVCMSRAPGHAGHCWGLHSPDGGAAASSSLPRPTPPSSPGHSAQAPGRSVRSKSLPSPCHLAAERCKVLPRRAWPGPAAGSQTDALPPPAAPVGSRPSRRTPSLTGRGPSGGGPPSTRAFILPERAPAGCDWPDSNPICKEMPVCGFSSASSSNPRPPERGAGRGQEARG